MMENDKLTEKIIATCYNVHTKLGPGFNERIYLNALKFAFKEVKLKYDSEKTYPVFFKNNLVGKLRVDLVIENNSDY